MALLSGRNFETRQYEDAIVEASFARLKQGISRFINQTHFKRFILMIRPLGRLPGSSHDRVSERRELRLHTVSSGARRESPRRPTSKDSVRRWYAMSILRGRYTGST